MIVKILKANESKDCEDIQKQIEIKLQSYSWKFGKHLILKWFSDADYVRI